MGSLTERIATAVPPQRVWAVVVDFEGRPHWAPRVKEATLLDGPPLREGSRIRLRVDRDRFTSTVVELQPEKRLVLLVQGPGFRVHHTYELDPSGGGTVVSLTGDYRGMIGGLVSRFMRGSIRRDLVDELAAIKGAAEAAL